MSHSLAMFDFAIHRLLEAACEADMTEAVNVLPQVCSQASLFQDQ